MQYELTNPTQSGASTFKERLEPQCAASLTVWLENMQEAVERTVGQTEQAVP